MSPVSLRTTFAGLGLLAVLLFVSGADGGAQSAARVSGVITDAFGHQIPRAAVSLYSSDRVLQTRANQDGQFEFSNVPSGQYELEAAAPGFITKTILAFEITGKIEQPLLISLAVAGTGNCSSPAQISYAVRGGTDREQLTGAVLDSRGPLARAAVYLMKSSGFQAQLSQDTNENGEFLFTNVAPGPYFLKVTRLGYHDEQSPKFWITRMNQTRVHLEVIKGGTTRVCQ